MEEKKENRDEKLIEYTFNRLKTDSAFRAALKKADNPDTEYMSWEYLAEFGVNVQFKNSRLPYTTVLSAVAKSDQKSNGNLLLGKAILMAYEGDPSSSPARSKLRRVMACSTQEEVCVVLKPLLQFINSKGIAVDYACLLSDLRWFDNNAEQIKAKWAQSFFGSEETKREEES